MYIPFSSCDQVVDELAQTTADEGGSLLWLLCVCDCHGDDIADLIDACNREDIRVCGGIFPGVIFGGQVMKTGLIAVPLPADSQVLKADLSKEGVTWDEPLPELAEGVAVSSILLLDCLAPNVSGLMEDLYDQYGHQLNHFGAGTGFHDLRAAPSLFDARGPFSNAALAILQPKRATVCVRHGWNRIAGPFVASKTDANRIQELNWEPAGTFYRQQVVEENPDYANRPVFPDLNAVFPLCIAREGGEDVMRDPIALTDEDEICVLSDVAENSVMYLAHGDHQSLIDAARQAVIDCGTHDDVEHCFISDCYSRVLMLGDTFTQELEAANGALADFTDVTPEGVLALGEVANNGDQYLELFNKTFVVALTHR